MALHLRQTLTSAQASAILIELGWPKTGSLNAFSRAFQEGWNLGPALKVDGVVGPITSEALRTSLAMHRAGRGDASEHFSFNEFHCKCRATLAGCKGILVLRELLISLEKLRETNYPNGLTIVSGYRCPIWNHQAGGAIQSQHMFGAAADVQYMTDYRNVEALDAFAGIGKSASTNKVRHVDRRDRSGTNPTDSTCGRPAVWDYAV